MKIRIILLICMFGLFFTCSPRPVTEPVAPEEPKPVLAGAEKEAWQTEWEKVVEGARQEGKLVMWVGSAAMPARPLYAKIFKDRYNIDLEWITGQGAEQAVKMQSERNAGIYSMDLLLGSPSSALFQKPKSLGWLEPLEPTLILPEVLDNKVWYEGFEARWIGKERLIFGAGLSPGANAVINTDLVKPGELTSHLDLLNPKWKRKILTNEPTETSASSNIFLMGGYLMGWDFVKQLVNQLVMVPKSLATDWVARGKYPITLRTSGTEQYQKEGVPIAGIAFKEGAMVTVGVTALALVNKAPHPNAARVFLNFYLSKEGQTIYGQVYDFHSAREDVPVDPTLPSVRFRQPGVKYIRGDSEEFMLKREEFREGYALEILAELMK